MRAPTPAEYAAMSWHARERATYSDTWARRYGHPEVANLTADQWPPHVQDVVAIGLYADWPEAWTTYGSCAP